MSKVPGNGARIAGFDYHYGGSDDDIDDNLNDLDVGGKLVVDDGHANKDEGSR